jgi:hypothetical protein
MWIPALGENAIRGGLVMWITPDTKRVQAQQIVRACARLENANHENDV